MNPTEVNCPLESWLQFNTTDRYPSTDKILVTTVKAVYEPTPRRTLLMWIMVGLYGLIIICALFVWTLGSTTNKGMVLLNILPFIYDPTQEVGGSPLDRKSSDLDYIMNMVFVNRKRSKIVRLDT